jgi:hypothetical protein
MVLGLPPARPLPSRQSRLEVWTSRQPLLPYRSLLTRCINRSTVIPLQQARLTGANRAGVTYFSLAPLPIKDERPIYVLSEDITNPADGCEPLPPSVPDLSKYVTIVRRGTCTFVSLVQSRPFDCILISLSRLPSLPTLRRRVVIVPSSMSEPL